MYFAYSNVYKNLDKGILEFLGPFGVLQTSQIIATQFNKFQNGRIENYLQIMIFTPLLFTIILSTDFYIFEILTLNKAILHIFLTLKKNIANIIIKYLNKN